ncbi:MAG: hypothetical protein KBA43_07880 [Paludibacteraceae bacterium]|nr:hypothetical protein [Paludibacteraceae bacterium]
MAADNKYFETGSNPYYLNLNNTAKDFSYNESTNPPYGLLDTLTKFIIVEDNSEIQQPIIQEELIIEDVEITQE